MSPLFVLDELRERGILTPEQARDITEIEQNRPVSLHWELRALLYAGILLLSGGLGLLLYKNYETIGRGTLLAIIALGCIGSFYFAWRNCPPWSPTYVRSRSTFGDYMLLLSCLLFLTLEGYAQYAYNVFGSRYGLVTLLPALLFLLLAYRFDHRGVLSMALTALISWVGVTIRPLNLYIKTNFFDQTTVFSAVALALLLIGTALLLDRQRIKPHFTYTYLVMAGNLLFIALLGGLFNFERLRLPFTLGLVAACLVFNWYSRARDSSYLFLLMAVVYGYVGLAYLFFTYVPDSGELYFYYTILTGVAAVLYLINNLPKRKKSQ